MILWTDNGTGFQGNNDALMQIKPWAWWALIRSDGKHFSAKRYPWRDQHILLERGREVCSELYGLRLENLKLRSRRYSPVIMEGPMALGRQLQSFILFVMPGASPTDSSSNLCCYVDPMNQIFIQMPVLCFLALFIYLLVGLLVVWFSIQGFSM